jgi:seryl-tRNA synthetase
MSEDFAKLQQELEAVVKERDALKETLEKSETALRDLKKKVSDLRSSFTDFFVPDINGRVEEEVQISVSESVHAVVSDTISDVLDERLASLSLRCSIE